MTNSRFLLQFVVLFLLFLVLVFNVDAQNIDQQKTRYQAETRINSSLLQELLEKRKNFNAC